MDSDEDSFEMDSGNVSSGDDADEDFPMGDIQQSHDRQAETDEYHYDVLSTEEIVQHQREIIDEVKGVIKVSV